MDRSPRWHSSMISALNSGVNERRRQGFFPMLSMIGHPSGGKPLMLDVRQSGSGPVVGCRGEKEVRPAEEAVQVFGTLRPGRVAQCARRLPQALGHAAAASAARAVAVRKKNAHSAAAR